MCMCDKDDDTTVAAFDAKNEADELRLPLDEARRVMR